MRNATLILSLVACLQIHADIFKSAQTYTEGLRMVVNHTSDVGDPLVDREWRLDHSASVKILLPKEALNSKPCSRWGCTECFSASGAASRRLRQHSGSVRMKPTAASAPASKLVHRILWHTMKHVPDTMGSAQHYPSRGEIDLQRAEPYATSESKTLEELKSDLLKAVAARQASPTQRKQQILAAAQALERRAYLAGDVNGRWSLIYSTMAREPDAGNDGVVRDTINLGELPERLTDTIYKTLFRFLPALAGGQDLRDSSQGPQVRNEQLVDLARGVVDNQVDVVLGRGNGLRIGVRGTVKPVSASALEVVFTDWSLGQLRQPTPFLRLPLPRPRGRLDTTFCDETLRLSRGGRGGLFVLRRLKGATGTTNEPVLEPAPEPLRTSVSSCSSFTSVWASAVLISFGGSVVMALAFAALLRFKCYSAAREASCLAI